MCRRKSIRITVAFAAIILCLYSVRTLAVTYTYNDDFETNQADMDSYLHSPISESVPDIFLYGILVYGISQPSGSRALGFYEGFEVDAFAFLAYRMPIEDNQHPITYAQVQFQIVNAPHQLPGSTQIYLQVSTDGITWPSVIQLTFGEYVIILPEEGTHTYFKFVGTGFAVDNLHVLLEIDETVPIDESTWGGVKALYK